MKKEKINNYYDREDLINFEKLENFKDLKVNELNNNQNKIHPLKYSQSDNKHFNVLNVRLGCVSKRARLSCITDHFERPYTCLTFCCKA